MSESILLDLLRCPVSKQRLQPAPDKLVAFLESERIAGRLQDDSGRPVLEPIEVGLVCQDGLAFYPIRRGIPVMLERVPLQQ